MSNYIIVKQFFFVEHEFHLDRQHVKVVCHILRNILYAHEPNRVLLGCYDEGVVVLVYLAELVSYRLDVLLVEVVMVGELKNAYVLAVLPQVVKHLLWRCDASYEQNRSVADAVAVRRGRPW